MPFTDLLLKTLDEPGKFEVVKGFKWWGEVDGTPCCVEVPEHFVTDLASIPWGMRNLFSKTGRSRKPAVVHDWLYENKIHTRKWCDEVFKIMLLERDISWFSANVYYLGVRAGGWTRGSW